MKSHTHTHTVFVRWYVCLRVCVWGGGGGEQNVEQLLIRFLAVSYTEGHLRIIHRDRHLYFNFACTYTI